MTGKTRTTIASLALLLAAPLACKSDPKPGAECKTEDEAVCQASRAW
jgi:predicted outer membrane protein